MTTSAELCKQNGWAPGTRIRNTQNDAVIEITAIGQKEILAMGVVNGKAYPRAETIYPLGWMAGWIDWQKAEEV